MSFRYQPTDFAPDPWPVQEATELDAVTFGRAIRHPVVALEQIVEKLDASGPSADVIVYLLFVGRSYGVGKTEVQGYYIRAVVRNRANLRAELVALAQTDPLNRAGQFTLGFRMIPAGNDELRANIAGWGFVAK